MEIAKETRNQLTELSKSAGFHIRKWMSNQAEILKDIPEEDRASAIEPSNHQDVGRALERKRRHLVQLFVHTRHGVHQAERFKEDSYHLRPSWFPVTICCKSQTPDTAGLDRSSRLG